MFSLLSAVSSVPSCDVTVTVTARPHPRCHLPELLPARAGHPPAPVLLPAPEGADLIQSHTLGFVRSHFLWHRGAECARKSLGAGRAWGWEGLPVPTRREERG